MSVLAALTHILFQIAISIRDATGRERFVTILAVAVRAHGLPGQYELCLHIMREEKIMGNGRDKKTGNS